jgi:hypothetical protein
MASYTTIDNPELYFQCKIYTGDGNDNRAITFDGEEDMQPNLLWFKNRGAAAWHNIYDSVRGANKALASNANNAEESRSDTLDSFDSNGFTVGNDTSQDPDGYNTNASSNTYVCWAWKESADAGMDIVSYTGNATNRTISHSLSAVPHWIIIKNRESTSSSAEHWLVYHKSISNTHGLLLNQTDAKSDDATYFQDTDPTSSVFSIGTADRCNKNSEGNIAYLFSEKQGFSKFGSFVANSNTDGPFIYTGFRPALVIGKCASDTNDWFMFDNKRSTFNPVDDSLYPNTNAAENTNHIIDFLSNGFKIRDSDGTVNSTGNTYIYMAFAEVPFVNSNGVPCNAR